MAYNSVALEPAAEAQAANTIVSRALRGLSKVKKGASGRSHALCALRLSLMPVKANESMHLLECS